MNQYTWEKGDILVFNAELWNSVYHDGSTSYEVEFVELEDKECFIGYRDGEKLDGYYFRFFDKKELENS
jgi:hypothetical protein